MCQKDQATRPARSLFSEFETIDARPAPSQPKSETSQAAAKSIEPRRGTVRARVLDYIRQCGSNGATREEIANALEIKESSICARASELLSVDLVRIHPRTRATSSGQQASVLVGAEVLR